MKLAIVTDSTAVISEEVAANEAVFVLPMPLIFDGTLYYEGVDLTEENFYAKLKESKEFPTTSQPSLGEVIAFYQQIQRQGFDTILSIHLSSGISGLVRNLETITDSVEGMSIHLFDSLITSKPMGEMVEVASRLATEGKSIANILAALSFLREHMDAFIIVDDLHHLVRGGRLTNGAALLGTLLNIKPILTFQDGKIVLQEKIRSTKKAFRRAMELTREAVEKSGVVPKFFLIHSGEGNRELAEKLQREFSEFSSRSVQLESFGPIIATHLGENAIGIGWVAELE